MLLHTRQTKWRLKDRLKEHKDIKSVITGIAVSDVANNVLNTSNCINCPG